MEEKTNTLAQQPTTCEALEQKIEILKKESAALKKVWQHCRRREKPSSIKRWRLRKH